MIYYFVKLTITTLLIVIISEMAKRSSFMGALFASIPLVSVLAMLWLYIDTKDINKVTELSINIFWLVLPSLVLFLALPVFLKLGLNFYFSLGISIGLTALCYWLMVMALNHYGI
ncbi:MAG: DUF3147 family protein [Methylococcaceae bacterium]|nr:DUF3147 family protein [Methylococcaceae bacterium]